MPAGVFWSFGFLLPLALVVGGIYLLGREEVFLPIRNSSGVTLTGNALAGTAVVAFGFALLAHFATVWRNIPGKQAVGTGGAFLGMAAVVAGVVVACL